MGLQAREDSLRTALRGHITEKAAAARERYGPSFDDEAIHLLLTDRRFVRFPVTLQCDARSLDPGCVAAVRPVSDDAVDGFLLIVHPALGGQFDALRLIVARHLVEMNYGQVATVEDAEAFGAALLDMPVEAFRRAFALLANRLLDHPTDDLDPVD